MIYFSFVHVKGKVKREESKKFIVFYNPNHKLVETVYISPSD